MLPRTCQVTLSGIALQSTISLQPIRVQVGGQGFVKDVPHLLVWGGEGTRMDADMQQALQRWTPALRQSREKKQQPGTKQRQEPA